MSLETKTITGLEILRTGRWNGRNYSIADLDCVAESFRALSEQGVYEPPGKLGHNDQQHLIATDGLPAVGWVSGVYRVGNKLFADFKDVPAKFAALVDAGAYRKRSAELWMNADLGGRTWPIVLRAVSWLGADPPAVKGMGDIYEMYVDPLPTATVTLVDTAALSDLSFDQTRAAVQDALTQEYPHRPDVVDSHQPSCHIKDLYDDRVIVCDSEMNSLFSIPFTLGESGEAILGTPVAVKVVYESVPTGIADEDAQMPDTTPTVADSPALGRGVETVEDEQVRAILGLSEDADIKSELLKLKATHVDLSDHQAVVAERDELRNMVASRDAESMIDQALRDGKLVPAQREWAERYCLSDKAGFEAYLAIAAPIIKLGESGSNGDPDPADGEPLETKPTDSERQVAERMGIPVETLVERREALKTGV